MATEKIIFGTRGSALALWQTDHAMDMLRAAHPGLRVEREIIQTRGDHLLDTPLPLVGGKGVFTAELEAALRDGRLDCAVHSLKDLPTDPADGLVIGAILPRANPADVLVSRAGYTLGTLPDGARVGTSSYRRGAQLLHKRPDLRLLDIRGNVDTRVRKALAAEGEYDAIVLAYAGLERLGHLDAVSQVLSLDDMLPAPGQGAIAVQTRDDPALLTLLEPIHHRDTALAVTAERAFLAGLGGGCSVPVAAYAYRDGGQLHLRGRVSARDGSQQIEVAAAANIADEAGADALGARLAREALAQGAAALMEAEA
jgi:hydroxymethylbilane synthase